MSIKKITLGILGLAAALTLLALFTNADYPLIDTNYIRTLMPIISSGHINISVLLFRYINILSYLSALIFFLYVIVGIVRWITLGKNRTKDRKTRRYIVVGVIGIAITLLAIFVVKMFTPYQPYCDLCIPGL